MKRFDGRGRPDECPDCDGEGFIRYFDDSDPYRGLGDRPMSPPVKRKDCERCEGIGRILKPMTVHPEKVAGAPPLRVFRTPDEQTTTLIIAPSPQAAVEKLQAAFPNAFAFIDAGQLEEIPASEELEFFDESGDGAPADGWQRGARGCRKVCTAAEAARYFGEGIPASALFE